MKSINRILAGSALSVGLAWSASVSAQDYIVNLFDTADEATQWSSFWGAAVQTYEFDAAKDADDNPSSGSLKVTVQFDLAAYGGDNQFSALKSLPEVINGLSYTNLEMDVFFDPTSPQRPSGDFGYLEYGIRHTDWSQDYFGAINVPITNGWIHLVAPIPVSNPGIDDIAGITFKMWSGDVNSGQTGDLIMWVDNIKLIAGTGEVPPPVLKLQKATPGLNLFASQPNSEYQRQNIRTVANNFSWVPVAYDLATYSVGITAFPDSAHEGFQLHLFLVPETSMPNGPDDTYIDWNAPNVVFIHIESHADGTALGRFMYKTNQPNGNSMLWNEDPGAGPVGTLAHLPAPQVQGIWSVTFDNLNGLITMTGPGDVITNFPAMPAESAALFANPLYAYIGIQPNGTNNIGQHAALEFVQIQSQEPSFPYIEDAFPGTALDITTWSVVAANPGGVAVVPADAVYWVGWTLPDTGFQLQSSPRLDPPSWTAIVPAVLSQMGGRKMGVITAPLLPSAGSGFFQMAQP